MYKRISYEQMKKREARRKRRVRVACALLVAAAAAGTSMALALNTLAAPENPEIEAEENRKAELKTTAKDAKKMAYRKKISTWRLRKW